MGSGVHVGAGVQVGAVVGAGGVTVQANANPTAATRAVNAISAQEYRRVPSLMSLGCTALLVSCLGYGSRSMTKMSWLPFRLEENAISFPLGDQEGCMS